MGIMDRSGKAVGALVASLVCAALLVGCGQPSPGGEAADTAGEPTTGAAATGAPATDPPSEGAAVPEDGAGEPEGATGAGTTAATPQGAAAEAEARSDAALEDAGLDLAPAGYQPLEPAVCDEVLDAVSTALPDGVEPSLVEGPFADFMTGGMGSGCRVAAAFDGTVVPATDLSAQAAAGSTFHGELTAAIRVSMEAAGWTEDLDYAVEGTAAEGAAESGAGGITTAFRRGEGLCIYALNWDVPSAEDAMPSEASYDLVMSCARPLG